MSDELVHRILTDPTVIPDPYPLMHELRRRAPVHRMERGDSWVLTRYDDCRAVLRDLIRDRRTVSIETIQRCACEYYGIRISDLMSRKRAKNFAEARQVAMYLARKMTNESYPAIAQRFAGRDHSTVIHACKTIERRIAEDDTLRATVDRVEQTAQSQA